MTRQSAVDRERAKDSWPRTPAFAWRSEIGHWINETYQRSDWTFRVHAMNEDGMNVQFLFANEDHLSLFLLRWSSEL